jgi:hypothetical protein
VVEFVANFPTTHAEIITRFRDHLRSLPKVEGKKTVAVLDSIVSNPGVLLPWQELVKICKEEGVWSVVDAAHSIGQEETNLSESQPDFWVSVSVSSNFETSTADLNGRTATNGYIPSAHVPFYTSRNGKPSISTVTWVFRQYHDQLETSMSSRHRFQHPIRIFRRSVGPIPTSLFSMNVRLDPLPNMLMC